MELTLLKCKLHRGVVTETHLEYEGSVTVDHALMDAAGLLPYEQVDVLNIANGARFTTYVIEGTRNSGIICVNGAAARLTQPGDQVILCAYARMAAEEARQHTPKVILLDAHNRMVSDARTAA